MDVHADLVYSHIGYVRLYHTKIPTIAGMAKVFPYSSCCENKSVHQLLGCVRFAHFAICPGTLCFFLH